LHPQYEDHHTITLDITLYLLPRSTTTMDGWSKISSSIGSLNLGQSANKFAKGFNSSVQATRERLGQVDVSEITELPQGDVLILILVWITDDVDVV
jgi:hypothetical protein